MEELIHEQRYTKLVATVVAVLVLSLLGTSIFAGAYRLRRNVRTQMVNRDGETLYAVALARQLARGVKTNHNIRLQSQADQLALALDISRLRDDVLAVRLYDSDGEFITAFPPYVSESAMDSETLADLRNLRPRSWYLGTARLGDLLIGGAGDTNVTPLLEVNIPIHVQNGRQLLAAAQLVLDARTLEREFARLDQSLWLQASAEFAVGGGLLLVILFLAFRRLERSHALLRERTAGLLRANRELVLAAKTGALGVVAAHLVHGLCNPLSNLREFVANRGRSGAGNDDWQGAAAATRQMQRLMDEVVRVLGEESSADQYEVTLTELADILTAKVQSAVRDAGVRFVTHSSVRGKLANRHANLVLLILENLLRNACEATLRGQQVSLSVTFHGQDVRFEVADAGPGLPSHLLKSLFSVCRSTNGGSGLGLAISNQLATCMGARLELTSSTASGCVFSLTLPHDLLMGEEPGPETTSESRPPEID